MWLWRRKIKERGLWKQTPASSGSNYRVLWGRACTRPRLVVQELVNGKKRWIPALQSSTTGVLLIFPMGFFRAHCRWLQAVAAREMWLARCGASWVVLLTIECISASKNELTRLLGGTVYRQGLRGRVHKALNRFGGSGCVFFIDPRTTCGFQASSLRHESSLSLEKSQSQKGN